MSKAKSKRQIPGPAPVMAAPVPKPAPKPRESEYPLSELVKGARAVLGVSPECVMTAFRLAGIGRATEQQARKIVDDFMKQEV